eukprot:jgi/Chlat1/2012/Chrsp158S02304
MAAAVTSASSVRVSASLRAAAAVPAGLGLMRAVVPAVAGSRRSSQWRAAGKARSPLLVSAMQTKPNETSQSDKPLTPTELAAENIGLPTGEGIFGFKPFAELWVGRLAMMGFLTGLTQEYLTGKPILQQIGLVTPNFYLLITLVLLSGGSTLLASYWTVTRAAGGQMEPLEAARYKRLLGLENEEKNLAEEEERLKKLGDFTSPDDFKAIADARLNAPADAVLSPTDVNAADKTAAEIKQKGDFTAPDNQNQIKDTAQRMKAAGDFNVAPDGSDKSVWPRTSESSLREQEAYTSYAERDAQITFKYAKQIELTNGRWAMLGFLGAIIAEAATGNGIIGQVISYLKFVNVLGPQSGF